MSFLGLFVAIAETLNLLIMFINKNVRPINIWQVVVVLAGVGLSFLIGGSCPIGATFFCLLLLYYLIGIGLENKGNPFNFNTGSLILFGSYLMAAFIVLLLSHSCTQIGDCIWHDWLFQMQQFYY